MKKILLTTAIMILLSKLPIFASVIVIEHQGETLVTPNNIEQRLFINCNDNTRYNISVRPIEDFITKSDGSVRIPIENLYINNNKEDLYLRHNEYTNVFYGIEMNGMARTMTAKIKNYGIVPAGNYLINFEVQATDADNGRIESTTTFNLRFTIPAVHELHAYSETPKITVGASDAFVKRKQIATETTPRIFIRSNTDWILSLDTDGFGTTAGNYYVRTTFATPGVTNRLMEKALITPGKEIILARGKAPAVNEQVAVEYLIENPDNDCIRAGQYVNRLRYILREGKE